MSQHHSHPTFAEDEPVSLSARNLLLEEVELSTDRKGVVILEPGSYNLRFGFAEAHDRRPASTVNCVAYRRGQPLSKPCLAPTLALSLDSRALKCEELAAEVGKDEERMRPSKPSSIDANGPNEEWELSLAQLELDYDHLIAELQRVNKNSPVRFLKKDNCVETVEESADSPTEWTNISNMPGSILCDQALYLDDNDGYDVYFPLQHGRFNFDCPHMTESGENRFSITLTHVLDSLERIWRHITFDRLEIAPKDVSLYDVLLVIPDSFVPAEVAHMIDLLLRNIGFGHVLLQKSSVCAALGAGRNDTCVVNIGFSGTTVCCVDDMQVIPGSSFSTLTGGIDVSRLLKAQLTKNADSQFFRYTEANIDASLQDLIIFEEMKESCCHLNPSLIQPKMYEFLVRHRQSPHARLFRISIGIAQFFAPMVLCLPNLDCIRSTKHYNTQGRDSSNKTSHLDENSSQDLWAHTFQRNSLSSNPAATFASAAPTDRSTDPENFNIGLAQLIVTSVVSATSELRQQTRLLSQILIVGGSSHLNNMSQLIESEVQGILSANLAPSVSVSLPPTGVDVSDCAWTGASYMASHTPREYWLDRVAWRTHGPLALREKLMFSWDNPRNLK